MCIVALITATATGYVYYHGGMADAFQEGGSPHTWMHGGVHGAPGPLMGAAGLPLLAVAYGVYRLVRRRRKAD
jgi:hypothetical protein